jgi:3-oxoacyl-[acyl-carrier protein] reductase
MGKLDGKIAIVTGASKGIGAGISLALAAEGAAVAVNYTSNRSDADAVVQRIVEIGGKAAPIQGNVSSTADVERIFAETAEKLGAIDILVNNAGVFKAAPLDQFDESEFHRHFNTNVLGVFLASKKAVQVFGNKGGNIINIGSAGVSSTPPTYSLYVSTKAAVNCLTEVLAKELASKNIRVNCINPGFVETEGAKAGGNFKQLATATAARTPLGRIGQPEDIGLVAAFLASDESRWLTGEIIFASGGLR